MRPLLFIFCLLFAFCEARPSSIIFDFGRVIAEPNGPFLIDFMATSCHIAPEQAKELLQGLWEHQQNGGDEESFWNEQEIPQFQERSWKRQWERAKAIAIKEIPGMLDLVRELQARGFKTPLFSNVTKDWAGPIAKAGFYDNFAPLFLSFEMNLEKPDREAYLYVLEKLALPPAECLFIDDKLANVEAAKEVGMDAIQFKGRDQLIQELQERKIYETSCR